MSLYRHLMLATDLGDESRLLEEKALQLRDQCGARLSLAHAVEYIPMAYSGDLVLPDDFSLEQELMAVARKRLDEVGERLGVAEEDRHLVLGSPSREVPRIAAEQGVDLLMVGRHGRHGIAALLGSTADGLLRHADCDLLAVRVS
jgi:universal stress protein A